MNLTPEAVKVLSSLTNGDKLVVTIAKREVYLALIELCLANVIRLGHGYDHGYDRWYAYLPDTDVDRSVWPLGDIELMIDMAAQPQPVD